MRVPDEARTYCRAKVRVRNWEVRQLDHRTASTLLGRSIWRPFSTSNPADPGVFPTRRYEVTPYEGASLVVDDSRVETLG